MAMETDAPKAEDHVFGGLTQENRRRLSLILTEHLPEVFTLDRIIEQKTGYASEICRNMKVDVLAHLATLAKRQHELSAEQQASQLAKIEEHLRRAIVEHPEEVLRDRIGDIEESWIEYQRVAYVYREKNELQGVPRHKELEELRQRIDAHLEAARKTKPDETTWEESLDAAAQVTEGADLAAQLADKLHQCIGEAHRVRKEKERQQSIDDQEARDRTTAGRRWAIGLVVVAAIGVGGFFIGKGQGDPPAETVKAQAGHENGQKPTDGSR